MVSPRIILASASPRRIELLKAAGFDFQTVTTGIDETPPAGMKVEDVPAYLARKKAVAVQAASGAIVIGADTVVILDGTIIGKPASTDEAKAMLTKLSSRTHEVITGVCLRSDEREVTFSDSTLVTFNALTSDDIDYYVNAFKPFDKAGAYAIQEWIGLIGIRRIEGNYFNVMGLPINRVVGALRELLSPLRKGDRQAG